MVKNVDDNAATILVFQAVAEIVKTIINCCCHTVYVVMEIIMKSVIYFLFAIFVLSGCSNHRWHYPDITELEIKRPITVPAGSSFAYIRANGQVVRRSEIGTYELYCKFLIPRPRDSAETVINPDTFAIQGIHQRFGFGHLMHDDLVEHQVAFRGNFRVKGGGTQRDIELFFNITSENQPQVKSLSCIRFADSVHYNMPTLEEVVELFGDLAEFKSSLG